MFQPKNSLMRRICWGRCYPFWNLATKLQKLMTELIKSIIKFWQTMLIFPPFLWSNNGFKTKITQVSHCVSAKNFVDEEDTLRSLRSILECSYQIAKIDDWAEVVSAHLASPASILSRMRGLEDSGICTGPLLAAFFNLAQTLKVRASKRKW